jgi:hypothetical protein
MTRAARASWSLRSLALGPPAPKPAITRQVLSNSNDRPPLQRRASRALEASLHTLRLEMGELRRELRQAQSVHALIGGDDNANFVQRRGNSPALQMTVNAELMTSGYLARAEAIEKDLGQLLAAARGCEGKEERSDDAFGKSDDLKFDSAAVQMAEERAERVARCLERAQKNDVGVREACDRLAPFWRPDAAALEIDVSAPLYLLGGQLGM